MSEISIIIPVYNSEKYISKCLKSLVMQTFTDIEIICVNDGSTDGTPDILNEWAEKDNRIRIFNQTNSGPAKARNTALQNASSPYVMFCDSDDWYEPIMCERMLQTIKEKNVDMVICDAEIIQSEGSSRPEQYLYNLQLNMFGYGKFDQNNISEIRSILWNKIFRKKLIDQYHIDFPDGHEHDDLAFILKYGFVANDYYSLDEKLYNYLLRDNSVMSNLYSHKRRKERELDNLYAMRDVLRFLKKNNMEAKYLPLFIEKLKAQAKYCYHCLYWETVKEYFLTLQNLLKEITADLPSNAEFLVPVLNGKFKKVKKDFDSWLINEKKVFYGIVKNDNTKIFYLFYCPIFKIVKESSPGISRKSVYLFGLRLFRKTKKETEQIDIQNRISDIGNRINHIELKTALNYLFDLSMSKKKKETSFLLFDNLSDKNAEAIDAYSFFLYLRENNIPAIYVLRKDNRLMPYLCNRTDIVPVCSIDHFIKEYPYLIADSSHIVTSFGLIDNDFYLRSLPNTQYIFIEHGVSFLNQSGLNRYSNAARFDKILVPTKPTMTLFEENRLRSTKEMLLSGMPRWDLLERKPHFQKSIFVFFTWRAGFQNNPGAASNYFAAITSLLNAIRPLCEKNDIKINIAYHHAIDFNNVQLPELSGVNVVNPQEVSKYIAVSDLLITDYSSICFDFMFLDIPVVFYRFDFNNFGLNDIDIKDAEYARSKDDMLYNCFYEKDKAVAQIEYYIRNDFVLEPKNIKKNEAFFWDKKNIRENLYREIMSKTTDD